MSSKSNRHDSSPISDCDKGRVVGYKEAGLSSKDIANRLNIEEATVSNIWSSWSADHGQQPTRRSDRRKTEK